MATLGELLRNLGFRATMHIPETSSAQNMINLRPYCTRMKREPLFINNSRGTAQWILKALAKVLKERTSRSERGCGRVNHFERTGIK